jgi:DNA mismatch endonuclease (patch repair protein)
MKRKGLVTLAYRKDTEYWQAKVDGNVRRDRQKRAALRKNGWSVIRVWEHEMKNPGAAIRRITRALQRRQESKLEAIT